MNTPIVDFVKKYINSDISRFHMPGHKGNDFMGFEKYDITEIDGADVLAKADGIICESEKNATSIFETGHTYYVTQGSTTAIYAMLSLIKTNNKKSVIMANRSVHKAFINACALLDFDVNFIMPKEFSHISKCPISPCDIEEQIKKSQKMPDALYVTSPDYLGNILDIKGISKVCKKYGIPLLVDNAHGAYLKFIGMHPIDLGADICTDSAHKTLSVLTGGAYLHISKNAPESFFKNAREQIALFSSTSPSYLILQSLDLCNKYLSDGYKPKVEKCIEKVNEIKNFIKEKGFFIQDCEPLKIVIDAKRSGYSGYEIANELRNNNIEPEFCDNDFTVLMITPQNTDKDFKRLKNVFLHFNPKEAKESLNLNLFHPITKMSIRDAVFAPWETIDIEKSVGRICASCIVSCPPAVPVVICGEEITNDTVKLLKYYGTEKISVVI